MSHKQVPRFQQVASVVLLLVLLCVLLLFLGRTETEGAVTPESVTSEPGTEEIRPQYYFLAQVEEITDKTVRVVVSNPENSELKIGTTLTLSTETILATPLDDILVGNLVIVSMAGPIEEGTTQPVIPFTIKLYHIQPR